MTAPPFMIQVMIQAADDLDAAADVIHTQGWCQHHLRDDDGKVCAEGAILSGIMGKEFSTVLSSLAGSAYRVVALLRLLHPEESEMYTYRVWAAMKGLQSYLYRDDEPNWTSVFRWNDRPGMTQEEVTDTIRRAAKQVREQAQS